MIYEHSTTCAVSKIQVLDVDRLYDKWKSETEQSKSVFYEFLKTPEAQVFICRHQSLVVERDDEILVLTSKFA